MKITEITVHAGRTFNHPHESYSNLRPEVTLRAALESGEDPEAAVRTLQGKAERMVEDHKTAMLDSIQSLYEAERVNGEISSIEAQLNAANARLDALRARQKQLPQPAHEAVGRDYMDDLPTL